jgi:hypothetical protein
MITKSSQVNSVSSRSELRAKLPNLLLVTFVTITAVAIFIPLNPNMPDKGMDQSWISALTAARSRSEDVRRLVNVDSSWVFAINAAVAQHLRFGKDVVFTFGPYGSIYTRSFHPATDRLMIFGSLLLALSYATALLYLSWGRKPYLVIIFLLFCATFPDRDALLLSYPFLLLACGLKSADFDNSKRNASLNWWQMLAIAVSLSSLGLLPVVKGSLLLPAVFALGVLSVLLLYRFRPGQAIPLLLIPLLVTLVLWILAGQSLSDLPAFLRSTEWLISGYTEAMSSQWTAWPPVIGYGFILAFLLASALILWSVALSHQSARSKWLLGFCCSAFLFVAFKHGFVRSDHESIAFVSLVFFLFIISFLYIDRYLIVAFCIVILIVTGIDFRRDPLLIKDVRDSFGTGTISRPDRRKQVAIFIAKKAPVVFADVTFKTTLDTYLSAWQGLRLRFSSGNLLAARYENATAMIRTEYSLPAFEGTVDIYTYEQALILASSHAWDPRPVFQSYSAYTPDLAKLNERHLRSSTAPDWLLFDLFAINGRLPSLEDGMSWPALLDNYSLVSFDGQFALLRRNQSLRANSNLTLVDRAKQPVGVTIPLPAATGPLFTEIELKPTLIGRLLVTVFKPPELDITLHLKTGETKSYCVAANMMQNGFFLSPLVSNTKEFASFMKGDQQFADANEVESISIAPAYGGSFFWGRDYMLTFKSYQSPVR